MSGLSSWALSAIASFKLPGEIIHQCQIGDITLKIFSITDAIWISVWNKQKNETPLFFRAFSSGNGSLSEIRYKAEKGGVRINAKAIVGDFSCLITFGEQPFFVLRTTCKLKVKAKTTFPFWPRDILTVDRARFTHHQAGEIHHRQEGTRSGLLYFSLPDLNMRVLYFQNLTALSTYCEYTGTSLSEVVGGDLPEIGLSLPAAPSQVMDAGTEVVISDAFVCIKSNPGGADMLSIDYLDMLATIYRKLPKPQTTYRHWPTIVEKGLKDLTESPGCWSQLDGNRYFNAYVSDYETPPEIMVQLAVLLPLLDYVEWSGKYLPVMKEIKKGLAAFYDPKLGTIVRWHPAAADKLKGEEEQKHPMVMDSWYLHHPLLNLSRLALKGDKIAHTLFLNSLDFAIKVARHFKYEWPVFYKLDTLEVVKAETSPGKGGEVDVPGLYTHVMLQAYALTENKKYLQEAEMAARKFQKKGFKLMYQANNTAFAAGAMLRLYKITGREQYLDLSYACLASIFQNVQLWDCNYGFGKHFPTFFALFPLTDAPYTAAYEEQEVFCALHDYLQHAEGVAIPESLRLLCSEYIRYLVNRAPFYYPPMLPEQMISEEVKMGEVDRSLWIALEDLHDGVEKSGAVGQEVYGAGNAFGILPRHFIRIKEESFLVFCDVPIGGIRRSGRKVSFHLQGDVQTEARLRVVPDSDEKMDTRYSFTLSAGQLQACYDRKTDLEAFIAGNSKVSLSWKKAK
ncbi:hypothetical protein [Pedobacter sp.]|uniref:hypothetical protein n=1 Tax=Pedobacter sp. TaxID=1411316 RepID=UPI003BA870AE